MPSGADAGVNLRKPGVNEQQGCRAAISMMHERGRSHEMEIDTTRLDPDDRLLQPIAPRTEPLGATPLGAGELDDLWAVFDELLNLQVRESEQATLDRWG